MAAAILIYIGIGLVVGALARFTKSETSSLAGMTGAGGVAGLIGGVVANLLLSDGIELDAAGLVGSVLLAIIAVLVVRTADRKRVTEQHPTEPTES
jgi:FtsH-binding integral membrane protein